LNIFLGNRSQLLLFTSRKYTTSCERSLKGQRSEEEDTMKEIDAHFDAYEHLKHLPREAEALHMIRKAASMVKPMMRKRGWKVGTLAEFLPDEPQLLGRYS
jgi:hypothetical protein